MKPSRIYPVEENACEARATTLRSAPLRSAPLRSLSLILKITLADNHRVSLLHSLRPRPPVMTMRLLMTGRMRKCHQSYVRALANCREAKERESGGRGERMGGRQSQPARYKRRAMQVMQKYDKNHFALQGGMAWEARENPDEGTISKA